jgi:hypothetical protein
MAIAIRLAAGVFAISLCLRPVYSQEQPGPKAGDRLDVVVESPGEISIRWHRVDSTVMLPSPKGICGNAACEGFEYLLTSILAVHEPTATVYIAAAGDAWQNRQWAVFSYEIPTKRLVEIGNTDPNEGPGLGTVSPSGRYIAFAEMIRAGMMGCASYDAIGVIDLREKRFATLYKWGPLAPATDGGIGKITTIRWTEADKFEFNGTVTYDPGCNQAKTTSVREVSEIIDIAKLKFD